ncbi:prepilin-type N-terminal cleavage/methylation domain-containing protein [Succinimonas amylolytica]
MKNVESAGFTLIELVVVIVKLVILGTSAAPVFIRF